MKPKTLLVDKFNGFYIHGFDNGKAIISDGLNGLKVLASFKRESLTKLTIVNGELIETQSSIVEGEFYGGSFILSNFSKVTNC